MVVNFAVHKSHHSIMKVLEHIQVLSYALVVLQFDFRFTEISCRNGLSGRANPKLQIVSTQFTYMFPLMVITNTNYTPPPNNSNSLVFVMGHPVCFLWLGIEM